MNKSSIGTWKCDWIGLKQWSGRREENLEQREGSNYFEWIEIGAILGQNLMLGSVAVKIFVTMNPKRSKHLYQKGLVFGALQLFLTD